MLDQFFGVSKSRSNVQIFYATGASNLNGFQKWNKPRGVSMVYMFTIAGGGGGGGGFSGVNVGGGGAGGACSGLTRFICPAMFLPDSLFVQVGDGGLGGAAGSNGGSGINSYVLTSPTAVLPNIICYSGVNAPGGGGAGTSGGGGTGGTVPTVAVTQPINSCGEWFSLVGLVGGAGTGSGAGAAVTAWATIPLSPGAGGGGTNGSNDFPGGTVNITATLDVGSQVYNPSAVNVVAAGGAAGGGNGDGGPKRLTPFFNAGGGGGGTLNAGTGGSGGAGGYGCGGGGGGGGTTGGNGGNGGDGLVVIISW